MRKVTENTEMKELAKMTAIRADVSIKKQQQEILVQALDLYLTWRSTGNDGRDYIPGWFT